MVNAERMAKQISALNIKGRQFWLLFFLVISILMFGGCRANTPVTSQPLIIPFPATPPATIPVSAGDAFHLAPGGNYGFETCPVAQGGRVILQFTVEGGSDNSIIFSIRDPAGIYITPPHKLYKLDSFEDSPNSSGNYQFLWDNGFDKTNGKLIRWNYVVYPPKP